MKKPPPPIDRWECRYSSCEMMYLEIGSGTHVKMYLDHSPGDPELTSFEDVLAGKIDGEVRNLFGENAVDELKAAVRRVRGLPDPAPETTVKASSPGKRSTPRPSRAMSPRPAPRSGGSARGKR